MAKKYFELKKLPIEMDNDELFGVFHDAPYMIVMRSLLVAEYNNCVDLDEAGEPVEKRTMRNLWYQRIKPVFSRLGLLSKRNYANGKVPKFDKKLSSCLAELVRVGFCTYEGLGITDGSRQRRVAGPTIQPLHNVVLVGSHYPGLVLFTEKDTIFPNIERLARIYGISVISGSGQPSFACTENIVMEIIRSEDWAEKEGITLLAFTDYDPYGYSISNSQYQQILDVCASISGVGDVRIHRLGLLPSQLSDEERAANAYQPPAGKMLDDWFEETGGVDGNALGLELDALSLSELRRVFVEAIRELIPDESEYHDELRESFREILAWKAAKNEVREIVNKYKQKLASIELKCSDDIVARFAIAGSYSIDPVAHDEHVFNALDEAWDLLNSQDDNK